MADPADTTAALATITEQLGVIQRELSELRKGQQQHTTQQKRTTDAVDGIADDTVWQGLSIDLIQIATMGVIVIVVEVAIAVGDAAPDWLKSAVAKPFQRQAQIEQVQEQYQAPGATGQKVADAALAWAGKDFKPGVSAQCAFFVRQVLADAGIEVGVGQSKFWGVGTYPYSGLAGSFFSDEIGQKIAREDLQPGDLVAFRDTYGSFPPGTITHIAIYVGDGMMVDRSTRSAPVYHRSIDTFGDKFLYGVRPHTYAQMAMQASAGNLDAELVTLAIGNAEGTRTPDGGYNASYYGHTDPGNGAANIGSFSYQIYQGGASTPEQADALQLKRLNSAIADAKAKGFNPETQAELINFLDLWNQAPLAAESFPARLQQAKAQGLNGDSAILKARVDSFRTSSGAISASGFGHSESRLRADQQRRMNAMNRVLK